MGIILGIIGQNKKNISRKNNWMFQKHNVLMPNHMSVHQHFYVASVIAFTHNNTHGNNYVLSIMVDDS